MRGSKSKQKTCLIVIQQAALWPKQKTCLIQQAALCPSPACLFLACGWQICPTKMKCPGQFFFMILDYNFFLGRAKHLQNLQIIITHACKQNLLAHFLVTILAMLIQKSTEPKRKKKKTAILIRTKNIKFQLLLLVFSFDDTE